ncbi:MAG TPA: response regulator, partial [Terriglobales bacterium]|nr:response regulator [Terriglobales bacterium]
MQDIKMRLLVVDDDRSIRRLCVTVGQSLGFSCLEADSAESALASLESEAPDLILADLMMPTMSGIDFLENAKKVLPHTEIAIMTGHGSIEAAVRAMRAGAYDFITKPFRLEELRLLLQRMEEKAKLVAENEFLRERVTNDMELNGVVGSSPKIQDVLRMVARLKETRTPVVITGESGTGKELIARAIHYRGASAKQPFVAVD